MKPQAAGEDEWLGMQGPTRGHCSPSDGSQLQHPCWAGQAFLHRAQLFYSCISYVLSKHRKQVVKLNASIS